MGGADRGEWSAATADGRDVSGFAIVRRRAIPLPRRARTLVVAGPHAEGLQGSLTRTSVRRPRIVDAAGAEPRAALRRAEHARLHVGRPSADPLLRLAGVRALLFVTDAELLQRFR